MGAPFKSYLDGHVPVIQATGFSPGKRNWTVLSIYHDPTDALPYQAEIVGDTIVEMQVVRTKRKRFLTLAQAIGWEAFDRDSALYEELRCRALEWLEGGGSMQTLTCVQISGPLDEEAKTALLQIGKERFVLTPGPDIEFCRPPIHRTGFDGTGGLKGAIDWLYADRDHSAKLELGDPTVPEEFADDFGIPYEHVEFALLYEAGSTGDHQHPHPGNQAWIKAFIASLRFFDREAFWANRAAG